MDIKQHFKYFILILVFDIVCSFIGFKVGYDMGQQKPESCQYVKENNGAADFSN